jgi:phage-related baseplate assembly protein
MSLTTTIDLSQLPSPDAVEALDMEIIYSETLADFRARYPAFTAVLESDMVLKLIEAVDYREFIRAGASTTRYAPCWHRWRKVRISITLRLARAFSA